MNRSMRVLIAWMALVAGLGSGGASASSQDVTDVRRDADVVLVGPAMEAVDGYPWNYMNAGDGADVNGDGVPDLIVSQGAINTDNQTRGDTWVVFGRRRMPPRIDLRELGDWGFVIRGANEGDGAFHAESAGDVNGDGRDDIIIGAWGVDNNLRFDSGSAYIVFGKSDALPIDLALFDLGLQGPLGYRIDGPYTDGIAGMQVDAIGDMNGDRLDDVIVAAPFAGRSYVVWGKLDPAPIDLLTFETDVPVPMGFRIQTPVARNYLQYSVAGVGDVNGDKSPDVAVHTGCRRNTNTCARVIFGKSDTDPVRAARLGDGGFTILGASPWSAAGAGDVNGDGLDDIALGAPTTPCCKARGLVHVVFGKRSTGRVSISDLVGKGYAIAGRAAHGMVGRDIASLGDLNGDGRDDLIIGAPGTGHERFPMGAAHVVPGQRSSKRIRLPNDEVGYSLNGARKGDGIAIGGVAAIGDLSGDDLPDMMVGGPLGEVYVSFGRR